MLNMVEPDGAPGPTLKEEIFVDERLRIKGRTG
jgi:hypothetical protein